MNKSVVKKIVKAKMLEIEAMREIISEIMPEPMKEKAETLEKEILDIAKELFWEHMTEKSQGNTDVCKVGRINIQFEGEEQ